MKKKLAISIVAALLTVSIFLSGCSSYPAIKGISGEPDASYAVIGNGTSAVMAGEYVYFVNGIQDLSDEAGDTNKWGNVVKGGLFRAKLIDGKAMSTNAANAAERYNDLYKGYYGDYKVYVPTTKVGSESYNGFEVEKESDYENKDVYSVSVTQIVPKKISSGIHVYGDWIYYTSPNNLKNKQGEVRDDLVDFFRTRHNGKDTQLLYTTKTSDVTNFGFYYDEGTVYLVVQDGTDLVSVEAGEKKVKKAQTIVEDVTTAVFASKPIFTTNMPKNQVEDFVYFTRAVTEDDAEPNGNVLERIKPNGDEGTRFVLMNNGFTITPDSIKTGFLYYSQADSVGTKLFAHSFRGFPLSVNDLDENGNLKNTTNNSEANSNFSPIRLLADTSNYSNIYMGNQVVGYSSDAGWSVTHYIIAAKGETTVSIVYASSVENIILSSVAASVSLVVGNDFYYVAAAGEGSRVYRANLFDINQTPTELTPTDVQTADHIKISVIEGYVFYMSTKNEVYSVEDTANETYKYTSGYMRVRRITENPFEKEWEMFEIAEEDIPEADEEEEETEDSSE